MENAPKDTEAISEPILEEEPSAEKYLFDATILRGKESYDAFTANISDKSKESLPSYDSLHIKQKLLFSHLRPEASKFSEVSLSRQVAAVDAHGLSIEDMSFDFDPDLRKEIHRAVLSEVVGDAKDSEEAAERLAGANATFREYLRQRAEANVRSEIQRTFTEKSATLRKEITDRYEKEQLSGKVAEEGATKVSIKAAEKSTKIYSIKKATEVQIKLRKVCGQSIALSGAMICFSYNIRLWNS